MKQVNVHEAKTHLSRLLDEVEAGEDIVIARGGKPAVRLVPFGGDRPGVIGLLKGKMTVSDDFDDPLPEDLLDLFEGKAE
ncbi:type II toxin-antitoxin system Phd/YefM family antitoxin [Fimbriimonas ginsengisoli]|uniref:Antitoxin n=1 Tax=Fimbriimonas ginsengisoli Gsoil 348 TaxID=661478 RepID=A0A068NX41_FIMGI|nr:type II toxin-antitoxin system Phd/YefM family antitoxin [Fimbriimonas ginsengisoli]AIE88053.1 prevent-host-death family protein [Fimbriimonas ginsengisoli Gsoil 348]